MMTQLLGGTWWHMSALQSNNSITFTFKNTLLILKANAGQNCGRNPMFMYLFIKFIWCLFGNTTEPLLCLVVCSNKWLLHIFVVNKSDYIIFSIFILRISYWHVFL